MQTTVDIRELQERIERESSLKKGYGHSHIYMQSRRVGSCNLLLEGVIFGDLSRSEKAQFTYGK